MSKPPPPPPQTGPVMPGAWGNQKQTVDTSQFVESPEPPPEGIPEFETHTKSRWQAFVDGEVPMEDLSDDEIISGRVNGWNGRKGRELDRIPRKMHDEMMRRILARGQEKMRDDYFSAIDTIVGIMKNDQNDPNVRLKAADMVLVRVAGKPVEKVELSVEVKPWQTLMEGIAKEVPRDEIVVEAEDDQEEHDG